MRDTGKLFRRGVHAGGILLVCVSLFFIVSGLWKSREQIVSVYATTNIAPSLFISPFIYALNCFLLSFAWQRLLIHCGQDNVTFPQCHVIYARSQIAKYIPGNVFHFAGRHLLGNSAGFQHVPLAGAALYEIVGVLFAAGAITLIGIVLFGAGQQWNISRAVLLMVLLVPVLLLFFRWLITKVSYLQGIALAQKTVVQTVTELLPPYGLYFMFFLFNGGILWGLVTMMVGPGDMYRSSFIVSTFALSWIAGFITPGSPAGIGVREAVIVIALGGVIGEPKSLLVAMLFRIATVVGDVLFFLSSYFFPGGWRGLDNKNNKDIPPL